MQNLNEKLEIMDWLSIQGLKPNLWAYYNSRDGLILHDKRFIHWDDAEICCIQPWFPLEQVFYLLPKFIDKPVSCLEMTTCTLGYLQGMHWTDLVEREGDFYLGALKLLKRVIEKYPQMFKETFNYEES